MPTVIAGRFDSDIAEKIYSNVYKGNPPFKSWRGKDGCAWFGYDGNPNPGAAARSKPVLIEAMVNIPATAGLLRKDELEDKLSEFLLQTRDHFPSAEGKLWTWVGGQGQAHPSGYFIVEVGNSRLSNTSGKYLLVNNLGMRGVYLSGEQQQTLLDQLDHRFFNRMQLKQQQKEALHGKEVKIEIALMDGKPFSADAVSEEVLSWCRAKSFRADPITGYSHSCRTENIAWGKKQHIVTTTIQYPSYACAKRNARRCVNGNVTVHYKDFSPATVPVNVSFGSTGVAYQYKASGAVVAPPAYGF